MMSATSASELTDKPGWYAVILPVDTARANACPRVEFDVWGLQIDDAKGGWMDLGHVDSTIEL
jgi:hypothetical protein